MVPALTREEVLGCLNDEVGREVTAYIRRPGSLAVMSAQGELQHWTAEDPQGLIGVDYIAESLAGSYTVGEGARFNFDQHESITFHAVEDDEERGFEGLWPDV